MSHFDELSLKYVNFRSRHEQAEKIANNLASAVRSSLGAPADSVFARAAAWSSEGWRLTPEVGAVSKRHLDGRFYFAICIRLASAEPRPEIFATLLSILASGTEAELRVEDTEPKFRAYLADPSAQEDLVGEVIGVIEDTLDPDFGGGEPARLHIGFVDARAAGD